MTNNRGPRCLLVAGGLSHVFNYPRYNHELCWWAERLDSMKYECWMCIADGNPPERPPASVKVTSARRKDVEEGLQWLVGIKENDLGLLVVSNHGDQSGICLWGPDTLTPKEVERAIKPVKGTMVCLMGQCHGGIFGPLGNARTVVLSACREMKVLMRVRCRQASTTTSSFTSSGLLFSALRPMHRNPVLLAAPFRFWMHSTGRVHRIGRKKHQ